jgi:hypothetical protein
MPPLLKVPGDELRQLGLVLDDHDEGLGVLPRRLWVWHGRSLKAFTATRSDVNPSKPPEHFA